jgi:thiol-disulfide isomerase/thioredoxin
MKAIFLLSLLTILFSTFPAYSGNIGDEALTADGYPLVTTLENGNLEPVLEKLRGKVIVMNVWATWCVPCVKEFPDLLELREKYHDKGVELVFLSVDDPDELESKVYPFLMKMDVKFETYIRSSGDEQDFVNGVDESWSGAIPLTLIYDRTGKKNTIIYGSKHFDTFEKVVKPLL